MLRNQRSKQALQIWVCSDHTHQSLIHLKPEITLTASDDHIVRLLCFLMELECGGAGVSCSLLISNCLHNNDYLLLVAVTKVALLPIVIFA